MQKTPYLLIIGDKEEKTDQISIRTREGETLAEKELANFTSKLKKEIENRSWFMLAFYTQSMLKMEVNGN